MVTIKLTPLLAGFFGFFLSLASLFWWFSTGEVAFFAPFVLGLGLGIWGRPEAKKLERALRH